MLAIFSLRGKKYHCNIRYLAVDCGALTIIVKRAGYMTEEMAKMSPNYLILLI
jgi:hypothetical protein